MAASVPNKFVGTTTQDVSSLDANFDALVNFLNSGVDFQGAELVSSYAAIRALTASTTSTTLAFTTGRLSMGDGGMGWFRADPSDTTSGDNDGTILVAPDVRRWKRLFTGRTKAIWFGVVADGITPTRALLQKTLDTGDREIEFPAGVLLLELPANPLRFRLQQDIYGAGGGTDANGVWGAATRLMPATGWGTDTPVVVIGSETSTYIFNCKWKGMLIRPQTDHDCGDGWFFAGGWNNSGTAYETNINRSIVAYGEVSDLAAVFCGGDCFRLLGNVFKLTFNIPLGARQLGTAYHTEISDNAVGVTGPGQLVHFSPYFSSVGRVGGSASGPANADSWAVNCANTVFLGGNIQGNFGARLGSGTAVYGTHIEMNDGSDAGSIGVQLVGRWSTFSPDRITVASDSTTALVLGDVATGEIVLALEATIPLLKVNGTFVGTTGIQIAALANMQASLNIGKYVGFTTDIDDARPLIGSWSSSIRIAQAGESDRVTTVNITAGLSLPVTAYYPNIVIRMDPGAGTLTLDATTPIVAGRFSGQILTLVVSVGATGSVTLINTAKLHLAGAATAVMTTYSTMQFVWNASRWEEISRSL